MLVLALWVAMSPVKARNVSNVTCKFLSVLFLLCGSRDLLFTKSNKTIITSCHDHDNIPQNPPFKRTGSQVQSRSTDLQIQLPVRKFPSNPGLHSSKGIKRSGWHTQTGAMRKLTAEFLLTTRRRARYKCAVSGVILDTCRPWLAGRHVCHGVTAVCTVVTTTMLVTVRNMAYSRACQKSPDH
jgi:hypothetical protein